MVDTHILKNYSLGLALNSGSLGFAMGEETGK
jgi:hypothetical protein